MKADGEWGGIPGEDEDATPETPEPAAPSSSVPEPDDDVQSYMSQLLSRMRGPGAESPSPVQAVTPEPVEAAPEVVEEPQPVGLLKPEEFIPKTKARRLDSLQDMRALANTQTRTAIDRSQAKRRKESMWNLSLSVAIASSIVAAIVVLFNFFGDMSFLVGIIVMISGGFLCLKTYFADFFESKKPIAATQPNQQPVETAAVETAAVETATAEI